MKLTKYGSHKIYACPVCWFEMTDSGFVSNKKLWWCHRHVGSPFETYSPIIFDSKAEYAAAKELKKLEEKLSIQQLRHHETFSLLPERRFEDIREWTPHELSYLGEINLENVKIPELFKQYESDFTFFQGGIKKAIEVKGLASKNCKRNIRYGENGVWKAIVKKSWPFFTREQPLSKFRVKAQLMKAFYKIDAEIWAGPKVFVFDEKWKLKEAQK